ncbi:MAG: hypothetical protein WEB58_20650 [Planctomycetaceae bacterium]
MTTQFTEQHEESAVDVTPASLEFGIGNSLLERIYRAAGPLAGGLMLDYTDFVTAGPAGPVLGLLAGYAVGYWISRMYGFSGTGRAIFAMIAALYCAMPFTNLLPLATIISAAARFFHEPMAATPLEEISPQLLPTSEKDSKPTDS